MSLLLLFANVTKSGLTKALSTFDPVLKGLDTPVRGLATGCVALSVSAVCKDDLLFKSESVFFFSTTVSNLSTFDFKLLLKSVRLYFDEAESNFEREPLEADNLTAGDFDVNDAFSAAVNDVDDFESVEADSALSFFKVLNVALLLNCMLSAVFCLELLGSSSLCFTEARTSSRFLSSFRASLPESGRELSASLLLLLEYLALRLCSLSLIADACLNLSSSCKVPECSLDFLMLSMCDSSRVCFTLEPSDFLEVDKDSEIAFTSATVW